MINLSFILPCYNVGNYISDCLNSIYDLGWPEDTFEVICVNDCSTDNTQMVLSQYSREHSNLQLIDHTVNLTSGGARNSGIQAAQGRYVWFVDPDDMIVPAAVPTLLSRVDEDNLDILFFNNYIVDENKRGKSSQQLFANTESLPGQDYVIKFFPGELSKLCIVWRCLFRMGFIKENDLKFPIMRKSQDVVFLWKALPVANRVSSCSDFGYVYRTNPYSVANLRLKGEVLFSERMLFANEVFSILENDEVVLKQPIRTDLSQTLKWCLNSILPFLSRMDGSELSRFYSETINHREIVRRLRPFMNRKHRFLFTFLYSRELWLGVVRLLSKRPQIGK